MSNYTNIGDFSNNHHEKWGLTKLKSKSNKQSNTVLTFTLDQQVLSLCPSLSLLSWSGLLCQPCSAWNLPSSSFLPNIYKENLKNKQITTTTTALSLSVDLCINVCKETQINNQHRQRKAICSCSCYSLDLHLRGLG